MSRFLYLVLFLLIRGVCALQQPVHAAHVQVSRKIQVPTNHEYFMSGNSSMTVKNSTNSYRVKRAENASQETDVFVDEIYDYDDIYDRFTWENDRHIDEEDFNIKETLSLVTLSKQLSIIRQPGVDIALSILLPSNPDLNTVNQVYESIKSAIENIGTKITLSNYKSQQATGHKLYSLIFDAIKEIKTQLTQIRLFFEKFPIDKSTNYENLAYQYTSCHVYWSNNFLNSLTRSFQLMVGLSDIMTNDLAGLINLSESLAIVELALKAPVREIRAVKRSINYLKAKQLSFDMFDLLNEKNCDGQEIVHAQVHRCQWHNQGISCTASLFYTDMIILASEVLPVSYPKFKIRLRHRYGIMGNNYKEYIVLDTCQSMAQDQLLYCPLSDSVEDECVYDAFYSKPKLNDLLSKCNFTLHGNDVRVIQSIAVHDGVMLHNSDGRAVIRLEKEKWNNLPVIVDPSLTIDFTYEAMNIHLRATEHTVSATVIVSAFNATELSDAESWLKSIQRWNRFIEFLGMWPLRATLFFITVLVSTTCMIRYSRKIRRICKSDDSTKRKVSNIIRGKSTKNRSRRKENKQLLTNLQTRKKKTKV